MSFSPIAMGFNRSDFFTIKPTVILPAIARMRPETVAKKSEPARY